MQIGYQFISSERQIARELTLQVDCQLNKSTSETPQTLYLKYMGRKHSAANYLPNWVCHYDVNNKCCIHIIQFILM